MVPKCAPLGEDLAFKKGEAYVHQRRRNSEEINERRVCRGLFVYSPVGFRLR